LIGKKLYRLKSPFWLPWLYPGLEWKVKTDERNIYLTFDDGPHPLITPWVLDRLEEYNFKATFFCIGENIKKYPGIFKEIKAKGHSIGNHTHNHLIGWKTSPDIYVENVEKCQNLTHTKLFRPPHGRITATQISRLKRKFRIIMWSMVSGDFDAGLDSEYSLSLLKNCLSKGQIIVFHDSEKAETNLKTILPTYLEHLNKMKYTSQGL